MVIKILTAIARIKTTNYGLKNDNKKQKELENKDSDNGNEDENETKEETSSPNATRNDFFCSGLNFQSFM